MAIQRPADARPVAAHAFGGFSGLIGHEVVAWRLGFVEMSLSDGTLTFLDQKAAE
jgi:hypothetical protein